MCNRFPESPYGSKLPMDFMKNSCPLFYLNWLSYKERRVDALALDVYKRQAFVLYVGGCDYQGKETMGQQLGTIEETKIPEFLVTLGRHVAESGMEFHEWRQKNPDMLENLAKPYLA